MLINNSQQYRHYATVATQLNSVITIRDESVSTVCYLLEMFSIGKQINPNCAQWTYLMTRILQFDTTTHSLNTILTY